MRQGTPGEATTAGHTVTALRHCGGAVATPSNVSSAPRPRRPHASCIAAPMVGKVDPASDPVDRFKQLQSQGPVMWTITRARTSSTHAPPTLTDQAMVPRC